MIFLAQTDTTAGLLSTSKESINKIKLAPKSKPLLAELPSLKNLSSFQRVPNKFKPLVRYARYTSFIVKDLSFRVVRDSMHVEFLQDFKLLYSSSANLHKKPFSYKDAFSMCDVLVLDKRGIKDGRASRILRINNIRARIIRR